MPPDTPPNDEDETYFAELLEKKGPEWLTKTLSALGLDPAKVKEIMERPASTPSPGGEGGLADFFRGELLEAKKENKSLRERFEAVLDVLTPEQRTLLKSPKSGNAGDPPSPPSNEPPAPPKEPTLPKEAARRMFKRL